MGLVPAVLLICSYFGLFIWWHVSRPVAQLEAGDSRLPAREVKSLLSAAYIIISALLLLAYSLLF